jgi:hypothetical protein
MKKWRSLRGRQEVQICLWVPPDRLFQRPGAGYDINNASGGVRCKIGGQGRVPEVAVDDDDPFARMSNDLGQRSSDGGFTFIGKSRSDADNPVLSFRRI